MVPTVEFPLATLFTIHVTAVLVLLATVAVKAMLSPARTFAVAGVTVTVVAAGVGGGLLLPVWLAPLPPHPLNNSRTPNTHNSPGAVCFPHIESLPARGLPAHETLSTHI